MNTQKEETVKIELTVNSSASSYGIPVARIDGVDYGPKDVLPSHHFVANVIVNWAKESERTEEEIRGAKLFLMQWPDGPQL